MAKHINPDILQSHLLIQLDLRVYEMSVNNSGGTGFLVIHAGVRESPYRIHPQSVESISLPFHC